MSDFHEYVTEIVSVADMQRSARSAMTTEIVRVRDSLRLTQGAFTVEPVVATDVISGTITAVTVERVRVGDAVKAGVLREARTVERLAVADVVSGAQGVVLLERVRLVDRITSGIEARTVETVRLSDELGNVAIGAVQTVERVRVADKPRSFVEARTLEVVSVRDGVSGKQAAIGRTVETVSVADLVATRMAVVARTVESVRLKDTLTAQYHAQAQTQEVVYVRDELPTQLGEGNAWTAPVDGWAMSRYDRYPVFGVVALDGRAYGSGADGVYALAGGNELIEARITTGHMDVGKGMLAHPLYAFLAYELEGVADMTVTQTQSGHEAQSYTYPLASEPARHLTNGRFIFGRGLRGRHFSFDLRLSGSRAHIDDLYVAAEATKRRV